VKDAVVIATREEARNLSTIKKAGVVSQSTQTQANLQAIVAELIPKVLDLRVVNTICAPSRQNQKEAERVARENEAVIVIGSKTSANTRRLEGIIRKLNPNVIHIASADELDIDALNSVQSIGITAGASTPDGVIRDVIEKIQTI
jgi:4-hydroxy-3-methylbut-2-enyl diphosphate reductase